MKSILCYGDSNTYGLMPDSPDRYPRDVRWTGILQKKLGEDYYVIEEGLSGRTTLWDDPIEEHKNGKKYLLPCLDSHKPVDLVILMLGTNDLKTRFSLTPFDIGASVENLVKVLLKSDAVPARIFPIRKNPATAMRAPIVINDKKDAGVHCMSASFLLFQTAFRSFGNVIVISVPLPISLTIFSVPPRKVTPCLTIERPSPVPPIALEWLLSTR